jgi:uncharacterized phage protein (TIGR02220 family)
MYGKIFRQIYDGSLSEDWQALVTFQQFLILCDKDGIVDMTLPAIQRVTNLPEDILKHGISHLENPDPQSRTPIKDGRRIERLDPDREWGWRIVNHAYYRNLRTREEKQEADRRRIAGKREAEKPNKIKSVAKCRKVSHDVANVANVAHTDTDAYTDTDTRINTLSGKPDFVCEVVDYLNTTAGTKYKASTPQTRKLIQTRLKEGHTVEDFKTVISKKCLEWINTDMAKFIRPETLFSNKFEGYLNQRTGRETEEEALIRLKREIEADGLKNV